MIFSSITLTFFRVQQFNYWTTFTNDKEIPIAKSILDYIFRWLGKKFLQPDQQPTNIEEHVELAVAGALTAKDKAHLLMVEKTEHQVFRMQADSPLSRMRKHHGAEWLVLQMHELRRNFGMLLNK